VHSVGIPAEFRQNAAKGTDDDDDDGNGAMGDKVHDDGDNNDCGDGQRRRQWRWRDGQRHDGIRQRRRWRRVTTATTTTMATGDEVDDDGNDDDYGDGR
jgi:hypothetical protein